MPHDDCEVGPNTPNHTETAVLRRPTQIKALVGTAKAGGCSGALYRREIPCGCVLRAKLKDEFLVVVALVLQPMSRTMSTAHRPSTANMTSRKRPTHDRGSCLGLGALIFTLILLAILTVIIIARALLGLAAIRASSRNDLQCASTRGIRMHCSQGAMHPGLQSQGA